jgi:hypothetical protein
MVHRAIRFALLLVFAGGVAALMHRLKRTPDQEALRRYVEVQLPPLLDDELKVRAQIDRLGDAPGLSPPAARALLVDDLIPHLVRHRQKAEAMLKEAAPATRPLMVSYLAAVDQLIDACRVCVRTIDDTALPTGAGVVLVRERFADADRARAAFDAELRRACVAHRLLPPAAAATTKGR